MAESVETSKIPRVLLFGALIIFLIAIAVGASRNFGGGNEQGSIPGLTRANSGAPGPDAVIASLEERIQKDPKD